MAERTEISWAYGTFNPWIGCTKVSEGCANCYAETQDKFRSWTEAGWGKGKPRRRTSAANWQQPLRWNRAAELAGERRRIFSASLADWLDPEVPREWQADFLRLVMVTPALDWLLLTKRIELFWKTLLDVSLIAIDRNDMEFFEWLGKWRSGEKPPFNVWLGTTLENQEAANARIEHLMFYPAHVRWLSVEPLVGPVTLTNVLSLQSPRKSINALSGKWRYKDHISETTYEWPKIDWVIVGGESGPNARPTYSAWVEELRRECADHGTAFHFKQWGEYLPVEVARARQALGHEVPSRARCYLMNGEESLLVGTKNAGRALLVNGELRIFDEVPEVLR